MTHDWIIRELADIRDCACLNGLDRLAASVEECLRAAEAELRRAGAPPAAGAARPAAAPRAGRAAAG